MLLSRWLMVGAVVLGVAVGLYILFFVRRLVTSRLIATGVTAGNGRLLLPPREMVSDTMFSLLNLSPSWPIH